MYVNTKHTMRMEMVSSVSMKNSEDSRRGEATTREEKKEEFCLACTCLARNYLAIVLRHQSVLLYSLKFGCIVEMLHKPSIVESYGYDTLLVRSDTPYLDIILYPCILRLRFHCTALQSSFS
jgi:hypothetical protein